MSDPIRARLEAMSMYVERRAHAAKMAPGGQAVWWTDEEQMMSALRAVLDLHAATGWCIWCSDDRGPIDAPCRTRRVIAESLGVTDAHGTVDLPRHGDSL